MENTKCGIYKWNIKSLKLVKNTGFLMNAANSFGFPHFSHASFPNPSHTDLINCNVALPILCQLNKFSLPNLSPPDSTFSHSLILD